MSQHHLYVHKPEATFHVLMGWDKPLQGYFMVIQRSDDIDEPFWSNLNETPSHPKTLTRFIEVLHSLGLCLPQSMLNEIIQDGENNIGNKEVLHQISNGSYSQTSYSI